MSEIPVSSRCARLNRRNSHSRPEVEKVTLVERCLVARWQTKGVDGKNYYMGYIKTKPLAALVPLQRPKCVWGHESAYSFLQAWFF